MLHSAVGNVFEGIEFPVVRGDFDAAFPADRSVEIQSAGIVECSSIDRKMVVVKAFIQRPCRGANPHAIIGFLKRRAPATAQAHADALGLGRNNSKSSVALRVDLRVLLAGLV